MERNECLFCGEPLDGSKEHIIPDSLNGRLTSKKIICSACNKWFGETTDAEIKRQMNPILFLLGFKNAQQFQVTAADNKTYLMGKDYTLAPVRPEIQFGEVNNRKKISVRGRKKDIHHVLKKMNEILQTQLKIKGKFVAGKASKPFGKVPGVSAKLDLHINDKIRLLFNKIALEYLALNNVVDTAAEALSRKVRTADLQPFNVTFCNAKNEIRDFAADETSHLIVAAGDPQSGIIRVYIELFNIYCGIIQVSDSYKGPAFTHSYYQDAITGKILPNALQLKGSLPEIAASESGDEGLETLSSLQAERHRDRILFETLNKNCKALLDSLKHAAQDGTIKESEVKALYVKYAAEIVARLALDIPYSVEVEDGKPPYESDAYNFYHSNFKPALAEKFIEVNQHLLHVQILIEGEVYKITSFHKEDFPVKPHINLIKLYVILQSQSTKEDRYLPIREAIQMLTNATPIAS